MAQVGNLILSSGYVPYPTSSGLSLYAYEDSLATVLYGRCSDPAYLGALSVFRCRCCYVSLYSSESSCNWPIRLL